MHSIANHPHSRIQLVIGYTTSIRNGASHKHMKNFIGILGEKTYREELWDHKPITDFWQVASGKAARLKAHGITTIRQVTMMNEDYLCDWFGIDAELLTDHAWGRESTTMADINAYKSKPKTSDTAMVSQFQVLRRDSGRTILLIRTARKWNTLNCAGLIGLIMLGFHPMRPLFPRIVHFPETRNP